MNKDIEEAFNSIQMPTERIDDEAEYKFRRNIAENYLSYKETIYTGERSKQDSLKKIHDYAKVWGVRNALETLIEWELLDPAQGFYDAIVDEDEEPDMVTGENRAKVLDMFNKRFNFNRRDEDTPKMIEMFNILVDEMLAQELSAHDLEVLAMDIWGTEYSEIG